MMILSRYLILKRYLASSQAPQKHPFVQCLQNPHRRCCHCRCSKKVWQIKVSDNVFLIVLQNNVVFKWKKLGFLILGVKAKNISPYRAAPKVKPFLIEEFLRSLESGGPQLTPMVKGDWEALYKRFFKSPNFVGWYNQRHREVSQKLQVRNLIIDS